MSLKTEIDHSSKLLSFATTMHRLALLTPKKRKSNKTQKNANRRFPTECTRGRQHLHRVAELTGVNENALSEKSDSVEVARVVHRSQFDPARRISAPPQDSAATRRTGHLPSDEGVTIRDEGLGFSVFSPNGLGCSKHGMAFVTDGQIWLI